MLLPHRPLGSTLLKTLFVCACLFGTGTRAQQATAQQSAPANITPPDTARAIKLYNENDYGAAIEVSSSGAERLREQAETLRWHADAVSQSDAPPVYTADNVTTRAQITSKPEPLYTDRARKDGITGMVRLRMLLSFDGRVRHIRVLKGLEGGLTEMAINAARGIKFTPATKDGRPVSQFVVIEYNFHIF